MRITTTSTVSSLPVYGFYKCPNCGKYNVFTHTITAETALVCGFIPLSTQKHALKKNADTIKKIFEEAKSGKLRNIHASTDCGTCFEVPAWSKYNGKLWIVLAIIAALSLSFVAFLTLGLFVGVTELLTPFLVLLCVGVLSGIGASLITRSINKKVEALEKCNLPTFCITKEELVYELRKVLSEEEISDIRRFNYSAVLEEIRK